MDGVVIGIVVVLAVSAFVQSVSGFGLALVAMAALPALMDVKAAIALVAMTNLFVAVMTLFLTRAGFSWGRAWPLVLGVMVGIPLGFFYLHELDGAVVIRVLGVVLIGLALLELSFSKRRHVVLPRWAAFPCALVGGTIGGAFNTGGPPIVAYVYSQDWRKTEIVAVLQSTFLCGGVLRNGLMVVAGEHTLELWGMVGLAVIPMGVAIGLGKWVLGRIELNWLRMGVFGFLLVMGVKYLAWP
jgi:uncharacterized membrane protein YfcA